MLLIASPLTMPVPRWPVAQRARVAVAGLKVCHPSVLCDRPTVKRHNLPGGIYIVAGIPGAIERSAEDRFRNWVFGALQRELIATEEDDRCGLAIHRQELDLVAVAIGVSKAFGKKVSDEVSRLPIAVLRVGQAIKLHEY